MTDPLPAVGGDVVQQSPAMAPNLMPLPYMPYGGVGAQHPYNHHMYHYPPTSFGYQGGAYQQQQQQQQGAGGPGQQQQGPPYPYGSGPPMHAGRKEGMSLLLAASSTA